MTGSSHEGWLSPEELTVWLSFLASGQLVFAELDRQLRTDAGIPHSWYGVLALLSSRPGGRASQSDLAEVAEFSLSRLSHAVSQMAQRGWLRREPHPGDRRAVDVVLTADGVAAMAVMAPGHAAAVRRLVFDRLSPQQVRHLHDACTTLLAGLAADGHHPPLPLPGVGVGVG